MVRSNRICRRGRRLLSSGFGHSLHFQLSGALEFESENGVELSSKPAAIGIAPDGFLVFHVPLISVPKNN